MFGNKDLDEYYDYSINTGPYATQGDNSALGQAMLPTAAIVIQATAAWNNTHNSSCIIQSVAEDCDPPLLAS